MYTSNYSHFNNLLFTDIFRYKGDVPDAGTLTNPPPPNFFKSINIPPAFLA